jgi:hypothetical protein
MGSFNRGKHIGLGLGEISKFSETETYQIFEQDVCLNNSSKIGLVLLGCAVFISLYIRIINRGLMALHEGGLIYDR